MHFYDQLSPEEKWNPKTRTGTYKLGNTSLKARLEVTEVGQEFMMMLLEVYDRDFRIGGKLFLTSDDPDDDLRIPAMYDCPEVMRVAAEKTQQRESHFIQFKLFCQESPRQVHRRRFRRVSFRSAAAALQDVRNLSER